MKHLALRRRIVATAQAMNARGLNQGTAGNVSARVADGFLITPSGVAYEAMAPGDLVEVAMDGTAAEGTRPSSEWRFHRDILARRPEVGGIVHAHAPYATTLACLGRGIPAFHYMVAVAGGDSIRCARYATFGTQALSDHALAALDGRRACLLAHHGMIAVGRTVEAALDLAVEVEALARIYWQALQVAEPEVLSSREMAVVLEKFRGYRGGHGAEG